MNPHYTYLILDLFILLGPLALSFDKKVAFHKQWRSILPGWALTSAAFIVWDAVFVENGVWHFANEYTLGIYLWRLPVEEWLFFLVVPYACAFVVACVRAYGRWENADWGWRVFPLLGLAQVAIGIIFFDRAYTASTALSSGVFMLVLWAFRGRLRHFRADAFLIGYGLCLVPFFISNGILTALPVVIYNNAENLGIRLYTIPVEDAFYGALLILGSSLGLRGKLGSARDYTGLFKQRPIGTSAPTP